MEYNDVIGTIMPDGTCHLMLVEKSYSVYTTATETTIYGKAK
jgi:hypothetical protein